MAAIPSRHDPCWNDPVWRTDTFLAVVYEHKFTVAELMAYTGKCRSAINHWRSGTVRPIPILDLRCFMLELALGGRNAIR
jgi:hypothetical protein